MPRYRIRKSVDVGFAHHIRGHLGACINLHGHTWKFEVDLEASELDEHGFVVDFSDLKREVLMPCFRLLDHALAIGETGYAEVRGDLESIGERLLATRGSGERVIDPGSEPLAGARNEHPGGMKVAVFPFNPTSERLAEWLHRLAQTRIEDARVRVSVARVYETLHPVHAVAEYRA
jgi:6-pyruvoyl tetrahydropterin synthase/QueD family protein